MAQPVDVCSPGTLPRPDCKSRAPLADPRSLKLQTCSGERQSGRGEEGEGGGGGEEEPINKEEGLMRESTAGSFNDGRLFIDQVLAGGNKERFEGDKLPHPASSAQI